MESRGEVGMQSNVLSVSTSEVSAGGKPRPCLADSLSGQVDGGFRTFAVLPSNVAAVEAAMLFAGEIQPFVAIVGPGGWGKTHLLEAAACRLRGERGCARLSVVQASDWATGARNATPNLPLILDNAQDAFDFDWRWRGESARAMPPSWPSLQHG
jgi:chromosomal replication initiation ATPase DnaA